MAPRNILAHMQLTYAQVTQDDLIENQANMEAQWDPTHPLENLWTQLRKCQLFAVDHDPISNNTLMRAALKNLEASGVFIDALRDWRKRAPNTQTYDQLKMDFNAADKERRRQVTVREAGYANAAVQKHKQSPAPPADEQENVDPSTKAKQLYYCWSHGLGFNKTHTSATCSNKSTGHRTKATIYNMMGGCNEVHHRYGERKVFGVPNTDPTDQTTDQE